MKASIINLSAVLACLSLKAQEAPRPSGSLADRLKQLDRDGDGKVTRTEARGGRWFDRLDRDGDGVLTLREIQGLRTAPPTEGTSEAALTAQRDLAYGEHKAQRLDVYAPRNAKDAPVMVYIHGGGWRRGDRSRVGQKAEFFTGMGWLLVSVNYRLLPEGKHPANLEDVAHAVAWVHNHIAEHGGDPNHLFLMGHSAGAHLAALVATDERRLKATSKDLAVLKGVIPLDTNTYDLPKLMESRGAGFYGQIFGDDSEVWRDAAPMRHVAPGKGIPPFLICYSRGMGKTMNPARRTQAEAFAKALNAANVPAEVVDASDRNHGEINAWFGDPKDARVTGRARAFLVSLSSLGAGNGPGVE